MRSAYTGRVSVGKAEPVLLKNLQREY